MIRRLLRENLEHLWARAVKANKWFSVLVLILFITLFAFAYRKIWDLGMLAYGDAMPFPDSASQAVKTFFSAWQSRSPGIVIPQVPVISQLALFEAVFITMSEWQCCASTKDISFRAYTDRLYHDARLSWAFCAYKGGQILGCFRLQREPSDYWRSSRRF